MERGEYYLHGNTDVHIPMLASIGSDETISPYQIFIVHYYLIHYKCKIKQDYCRYNMVSRTLM